MTANQIAYVKYLEDVRTHQAQEHEAYRANRAREAEQTRGNTLNYQASIYSTDAALRNADVNAATQKSVAAINSATQLQIASVNADTARRGQDVAAQTADKNRRQEAIIAANQLQEQQRSHVSQEKISTVDTIFKGFSNVAHAVAAAGFLA